MKIGVFDSGIGGEAVAASLRAYLPEATFIVVNDRAHLPYGSKTPEDIIRLTDAAIQPLLLAGCDIIVIACNTATAAAIETLRARYPLQRFIGIEPMVKKAASLTKTGIIAVCATPATLASGRYRALKEHYAAGIRVIEPDCSRWAFLIENDNINRRHIDAVIEGVCNRGADVIVLGCTHYHWIKGEIAAAARGRALVVEPSEALARRAHALLGCPAGT